MFRSVLTFFRPELILDIGSRNGNDAQSFRHASPQSKIVAFEANPQLFDLMAKNSMLQKLNVKVEPFAISNEHGEAEFSIFNTERGTGSLKERTAGDSATRYRVQTRTLDELFGDEPEKTAALWIDVEGHTYEVLQGAQRLLNRTLVIHAEVESHEIFQGQRLSSEVVDYLSAQGFEMISGGMYPGKKLGDMLFLRRQETRNLGLLLMYNRIRAYHFLAGLARRLRFASLFPKTSKLIREKIHKVIVSNPSE